MYGGEERSFPCANTLRSLWVPLRCKPKADPWRLIQCDNREELSPPVPEITHCLCFFLPECKHFCSGEVLLNAKPANLLPFSIRAKFSHKKKPFRDHQRHSVCSLQPIFCSPSLCKCLKLALILLSAQIGCVRKELQPSWVVPAWSIPAAPQRQGRSLEIWNPHRLHTCHVRIPSWRTRFPASQGTPLQQRCDQHQTYFTL